MTQETKSILRPVKAAALSLLVVSTLGFSTASQAVDADRLVSNLCDAAKKDNRTSMRKKLKSAKIRLRKIYTGINCGADGSLLRTATSSGSLNAATFIATKIGKKNLAAVETDGQSIVQWTQGLVSAGDSSKQAFVDLYNSKL